MLGLETVLDHVPCGVVLLHEDGSVRLNAAAEAFAIRSVEDRDGPFDARVAGGSRVAWADFPVFRAFAARAPVEVELTITTKCGEHVPVSVVARPIEAEGRPAGAIAVLRVDERRERWSSMVAHDLRQPLAAVMLSLGLLRSADSDPAARRHIVQRIREAVERMSRLVEDLLDDARIETGRLRICSAPVDLVPLVREIVERSASLTRGHVVHLHVPSEPTVVRADACRVEQVLLNLLSNAVKYGREGADIALHVDARAPEVVLSVTNRGEGLSAEDCRRVFERSFRTARAEAGTQTGLGLGLYIARGIVEAHGGRIWVECGADTTTFAFALPR